MWAVKLSSNQRYCTQQSAQYVCKQGPLVSWIADLIIVWAVGTLGLTITNDIAIHDKFKNAFKFTSAFSYIYVGHK